MSISNRIRHAYKANIPNYVRECVLVRRRRNLFVKNGIVFIHIPKAAGSSISQELYGKFIGHISARALEQVGGDALLALPRFALTRNPWSRSVSAWRFARAGTGSGEGLRAGILDAERYQSNEFASFERFVLDWLPNADLKREDGVFKPQSHYICDRRGELIVDHLGRIENMAATEDWLQGVLGRTIKIPHVNRSGDKIDYRSFYTDEMRDSIAHTYADDISLFNYDF